MVNSVENSTNFNNFDPIVDDKEKLKEIMEYLESVMEEKRIYREQFLDSLSVDQREVFNSLTHDEKKDFWQMPEEDRVAYLEARMTDNS